MAKNVMEISIFSEQFSTEHIRVLELHGHEKISELFEFELKVSAPRGHELRAAEVTGAPVLLRFLWNGHEKRRIFGIVAEMVDLYDSEGTDTSYRLRFVPEAWRLGFVQLQEITMGQNLQQIIVQKLGQVGLENVAFVIRDPDPAREFVVQYQETDLAFLGRLTEHVGWSYYFDHSGEEGRIVFTDQPEGFLPIEDGETIRFHKRGETEGIYRLELATNLIPAVYAVNDFDYTHPLVDISAVQKVDGAYAGGVVEFGTHYASQEEGAIYARIRAEEASCRTQVFRGEASVCTLAAGSRVVITGHPRLGDVPVLVTSCSHHVVVHRAEGETDEPRFLTKFEAIPAASTYRPPRVTPRPRIAGVMSGIVQADPGVDTQKAWIDSHGRYLIRMLFETTGPSERKASLPIRMAQPHSGPGYGMHFPLRPGAEVLVTFMGGDPDRPVIVGSVPNAATPTPVDAQNASYHRIKTWSGVYLEIDDGG